MEEKRWVALDILLNEELYNSLSAVEQEELQLNDEYKTQLRAENVARILELPHEIQLSLPHLASQAEIEAHGLLMKYTHEHGDAEFSKADEGNQSVENVDTVKTPWQHECSAPKQKKIVVYESMSDVGMQTTHCPQNYHAVVRIEEREVYCSAGNVLAPQQSRAHSFSIRDTDPLYATDLTVRAWRLKTFPREHRKHVCSVKHPKHCFDVRSCSLGSTVCQKHRKYTNGLQMYLACSPTISGLIRR